MSQDESRQNDRNFPRLRPRDDGGQRKGPKFNIYWVWAIIFAVLVGFQLFGSFAPDAKTITDLDFYKMLDNGDVEKLNTVTNKNTVNETPYHSEGQQSAHWILIDYVNVVVHIMQPETRKFYKLEEMWSDGEGEEY